MVDLTRRRNSLYVEGDDILPGPGAPGSPMGLRRFALLIHGYNNDTKEARRSYVQAQRKLHHAGVNPVVRRNIWEFYWPGYVEGITSRYRRTRRGGPASDKAVEPFSAASYSAQVPKARRLGRRLGAYLSQLSGPQREPTEVVVIAHSLGCRLALEAIRWLQDRFPRQGSRLPAVCLMAAAVPTEMLGYLERFSDTAFFPDRTYVLYSRRDFVLHRIFPLGQSLAFEGFAAEAVGYRGQPRIWSGSDETMLAHGEYWRSGVTTPHLARLFGVATREALPRFEHVEWQPPPSNELPESPPVADWQAPERPY